MSSKAESRLIYNSISTSERVSSLGVKGALLFTWLITHCDAQGRMPGKPVVVRQQVVPFIDEITVVDVQQALIQMVEKKLIIGYEDSKGRTLIQVADWWDWQTKLKYIASSHYQPPDGWVGKVTPRDGGGKFTREEDS